MSDTLMQMTEWSAFTTALVSKWECYLLDHLRYWRKELSQVQMSEIVIFQNEMHSALILTYGQ